MEPFWIYKEIVSPQFGEWLRTRAATLPLVIFDLKWDRAIQSDYEAECEVDVVSKSDCRIEWVPISQFLLGGKYYIEGALSRYTPINTDSNSHIPACVVSLHDIVYSCINAYNDSEQEHTRLNWCGPLCGESYSILDPIHWLTQIKIQFINESQFNWIKTNPIELLSI